jgi:hypothetical protein
VNKYVLIGIIAFSAASVLFSSAFDISHAQTVRNDTNPSIARIGSTNDTFISALDLFVVPETVGGYGVYEEHPNAFSPGEDIVLYVEPVGFSHEPVRAALPSNETLYLMNFTADVFISDTERNVLGGFQDLPISQIVSHHQNKEINLVITLSQSAPFPEGSYRLLYTIHDEPSGNTFEIARAVNITSENG